MRQVKLERKTKETDVYVSLCLDGKRQSKIATGIGFLDHMLDLFAFHGKFDLEVQCKGDLHIDPHHSIEDIAIVLGTVIEQALENKAGIRRYAFNYLPMDETLCRTVLDISGRSFHHFEAHFCDALVGSFPVQMVEHFFYSLAINSKITLHQTILYGSNDHHKIEALFKGFGKALRSAVEIVEDVTPSSKGKL